MKATVLLSLMLAVAIVGHTAEPPPFAAGERFVSVVQYYGGAGPHWTVWAIQPKRLTIYTQSGRSGVPDKLLAEIALSGDQAAKIRKAAAALLRSAKGKVWYSPDVMDGVALSVHFAADGASHEGDTMIENVWRREFGDLCESISIVVPPDLRITFAETVLSRPEQHELSVVSTTMKDFRNR